MRKTKIIATIGPKSANEKTVTSIIKEGADACRLNFSFGTHDDHLGYIKLIREASSKLNKPVAILADLQGPKIRIGILKEPRRVEAGDLVSLSGHKEVSDDNIIPTTHANIANDVSKGSELLIADGTIRLVVEDKNDEEKLVICKTVTGGLILSGKGINLPGAHVTTKVLTDKDISDALFAAKNGANYLGLSFVRHADDVIGLRKILSDNGFEKIGIISKIENTQSLENLESIVEESDGVMVARGDLGVEIPFSEVPIQQKRILKITNERGKISIIATQMLESMTKSPVPTRAESSDVANAVIDGTDVVMMSGETAFGDYPIEAVVAMAQIVSYTESAIETVKYNSFHTTNSITRSIAESAAHLSYSLDNKVIIALSRSGKTVTALSKRRPKSPIVYLSSHAEDCASLSLWHNVFTIEMPEELNFSESIKHRGQIDLLEKELIDRGFVSRGDTALVVSGSKWQGRWQENSIRIVEIR